MDDTTRKRPRPAASHSPKPGGGSHFGGGDGLGDAASGATAAAAMAAASLLDRARAAQLRKSSTSSSVRGARAEPDHSQRNAVLNDLLRVTSAHDKNYALSSDEILRELVRIAVCDCVMWPLSDLPEDVQQGGTFRLNLGPDRAEDPPTMRSKTCWSDPPTKGAGAWADHWRAQLGRRKSVLDAHKQQTLEVILVLMRNLTFVAANLRLLAYSPDVIHLLVGCLYEGTDNYRGSEDTSAASSTAALAYSAMHALLNLAPYLDVSGQRLCSDRLFYKPAAAADTDEGPKVPDADAAYGQAVGGRWGWGGLWLAKRLDTKEDSLSDVSKDFILTLASDYLIAVWSIFPALSHVLTNPKSPRSVVLVALDFLLELVNAARAGMVGAVSHVDDPDTLPSLRQILVGIPDPLLGRLLGLLYVPRLGPDSLEYLDPVTNVVTRVTTLKLLTGYDATVDTEVRDRVLEVLVPLMELDSPRMAERMGTTASGQVRTRLFESVLPILSTAVGRQEASGLALHFFRELNAAPQNRVGFLYVQDRLVELAARDSRVSSLVWNHLYVSRTSDTSTDEESDGEDDEDNSSANDSDAGTDRAMDDAQE